MAKHKTALCRHFSNEIVFLKRYIINHDFFFAFVLIYFYRFVFVRVRVFFSFLFFSSALLRRGMFCQFVGWKMVICCVLLSCNNRVKRDNFREKYFPCYLKIYSIKRNGAVRCGVRWRSAAQRLYHKSGHQSWTLSLALHRPTSRM